MADHPINPDNPDNPDNRARSNSSNPLLEPLDLAGEFPALTLDVWKSKAEASLKGRPLKKLHHRTLDGIDIEPLYSAENVDIHPGRPGHQPFLRARTDSPAPWQRCEMVEVRNLETAAAALASAPDLGAESVWLRLAPSTDTRAVTSAQTLTSLLSKLDVERTSLHLDPGGSHLAVTAALATAFDTRDSTLAAMRGSLGCDPLGALARTGSLPTGLVAGLGQLAAVTRWASLNAPLMAPISASVEAYHLGGASPAQEIAFAVATGLEYLRALQAAGVDGDAVPAPRFILPIGRDVFAEIAKLRATRAVWAKAAEACSVGPNGRPALIHAIASERTMTRHDPWINLLRVTTQVFAAAVGGADTISALPFDRAHHEPSDLARRLALNTQHILAEESHLDQVVDPAGGSWYVEHLTNELASSAWALLAEIEKDGGMASWLLLGKVAAAIDAVSNQRDRAIATRRWPITGVSSYPLLDEKAPPQPASPPGSTPSTDDPESGYDSEVLNRITESFTESGFSAELVDRAIAATSAGVPFASLDEALNAGASTASVKAIPARPEAAQYEELRSRSDNHLTETGARPLIFLANLGPVSEHKPRVTFATSLFEAGGVATVPNDGFSSVAEATSAFLTSGAKVAVICSSDEHYEAEAVKAAQSLKAAGAERLYLAGRPGEHENQWREAGIDGFVHLGCNVLDTLSDLLDHVLDSEVWHG